MPSKAQPMSNDSCGVDGLHPNTSGVASNLSDSATKDAGRTTRIAVNLIKRRVKRKLKYLQYYAIAFFSAGLSCITYQVCVESTHSILLFNKDNPSILCILPLVSQVRTTYGALNLAAKPLACKSFCFGNLANTTRMVIGSSWQPGFRTEVCN